jgi:hypothetical protein
MAKAYTQWKYETLPGFEGSTDTLSTKTIFPPLMDFTLGLGTAHMQRDDEMRGTDEPVPVITEDYNPTWSATVRMYPDLAGFFLKGILGAPVTTAGNGVITDPDTVIIPATANRHVWTSPFGPAGVNPQTMQVVVAYVEEGVFWRVKGMVCDEFEITTPDSGGAMIKMSGRATFAQRISDPVLTPVPESIAIRPFVRSGLNLPSWLAASGVHEDYSTKITAANDVDSSLGAGSKFPDLVEKGDGLIVITGDLAQRRVDADDIDALIAATSFATKAKWLNESIIVAATKHALWQELSAAQYVDGDPDPLTNSRRHPAKFSLRAANNGAAAATWTLVNATASYA